MFTIIKNQNAVGVTCSQKEAVSNMPPRWGFEVFRVVRFYKHANPTGLNVLKIQQSAKRSITVATKNLRDGIEIRIRGNGIPPDIREKIFNPFL